MSPQRALCEVCWREACARFKLDQDQPRENKTRHEHYREVLREMGSHDDGHPQTPPPPPGTREVKANLILEIPQDEGDEFPDYVLIRQGQHARAYKYPPGDGAGDLLLELRDILEWIVDVGPFAGQDVDGGELQNELVSRGILVEIPATEEYQREFEVETMLALAWRVS